ncbi:MAG: heme A synthase [Candidatus Melainabacteria bacterium HGW-Melainabacteria-1]|nr:MAG: heme A synthase [Candidatus Melainabacteria bacterium HGW-Melainabacteria-1]
MNSPSKQAERSVEIWLWVLIFLIFSMVLLGGITRLTHSGLSIVEWKPLMGAIPPLSQGDWLVLFHRYQAFPEYQLINQHMTLEGFQAIFYLEYFHRLLGRLIGLVFLLPLLYFALKKILTVQATLKLGGIFLLGGLQGAMGWYMVQSGLVDIPRVSPYRLTAHLLLALLLIGLLLRQAFLRRNPQPGKLHPFSTTVLVLLVLMIALGGFVAGNKAGLAFNTFPLMQGRLIPADLYTLQPWWRDCFENLATVQFHHRLLGWLLLGLMPVYAFWLGKRAPILRRSAILLASLTLFQFSLGVFTLLYKVPVNLAAAHQGGGVLLLGLTLWVSMKFSVYAGLKSEMTLTR